MIITILLGLCTAEKNQFLCTVNNSNFKLLHGVIMKGMKTTAQHCKHTAVKNCFIFIVHKLKRHTGVKTVLLMWPRFKLRTLTEVL